MSKADVKSGIELVHEKFMNKTVKYIASAIRSNKADWDIRYIESAIYWDIRSAIYSVIDSGSAVNSTIYSDVYWAIDWGIRSAIGLAIDWTIYWAVDSNIKPDVYWAISREIYG